MIYLIAALSFLVQILFDLLIFVFIARFVFQLVKANFFNPLLQGLLKLTNPPLIFFKRFIPSIRNIDIACLVFVLILAIIKIMIINLIHNQQMPSLAQCLVGSLMDISGAIINFFFFAIIIQALMTWISPQRQHPLNTLLDQITAPLLRPLRRLIPPISGFDISPIFALIGLQLLKILIAGLLAGMIYALGIK